MGVSVKVGDGRKALASYSYPLGGKSKIESQKQCSFIINVQTSNVCGLASVEVYVSSMSGKRSHKLWRNSLHPSCHLLGYYFLPNASRQQPIFAHNANASSSPNVHVGTKSTNHKISNFILILVCIHVEESRVVSGVSFISQVFR